MRVLVCGGRSYKPTAADAWALRAALRFLGATAILHGGARGVDEWAGRIGIRLGLPVRVFPADWEAHGRAAGPIRNRAMLEECDVVVAFEGGPGTADCVRQARSLGLQVILIESARPRQPARATEGVSTRAAGKRGG